jgi:hypothetical protein
LAGGQVVGHGPGAGQGAVPATAGPGQAPVQGGAGGRKTGEPYKLLLEQLRALMMPNLKRDLRLKACQVFNTVVLADKSPYTLVEKYQVKEEAALQKGQRLTQLLNFFQDKTLIYQPTDSLDVGLFISEIMAKATPLADDPEVVTAKAIKERFWGAPGLKLLRDDGIVRQSILKAVQDGKVLVQLSDGRVYDAQGYIQPVNGKRRRASGSLTTLPLDEGTLLTLSDSATGKDWGKVERRISELHIRDKSQDIAGLQIADLIVSPIGRHVIGKSAKADWEIIKQKFRRAADGRYKGFGLVVLPKKE